MCNAATIQTGRTAVRSDLYRRDKQKGYSEALFGILLESSQKKRDTRGKRKEKGIICVRVCFWFFGSGFRSL